MAYEVKTVKREWEGHETALQWGRYPVEHEPIRRHCHMIDDANPLFIEEGRCPPGDGPITRTRDLEWFRPVRVGDRLGVRHKVASIHQRSTRLDPLSVWIRTETTIVNAREEVVARRINQILVHRTPEEIATG